MVRYGVRLSWLAVALCWAQQQETVKYGVKVQPGPMDTVLLKDYRPESSLVVPETRVDKARFPVIDVHTHTFMSNIRTPADVDEWIRTMDEVGVEKSIVLTGAIGDEFARQVELYLKRYPHRFQLWCGIDTRDMDAPDYPERVVRELERCYRLGARGVGELTDKGAGMQEEARPPGQRLHLDDPRLDPLWRKCAELRLPVNLHVADHPSCWRPLGPTQERTPDFQHFNLYGKDVLSYEELLARRDRLLARYPRTAFILCHFSNQGNDLASLARALDRFPNLYVDISARDYELGRQPRFARRFLEHYGDRVLFGTDMGRQRRMYRMWWRLLETPDEYMPGRIWWRYYGLELSAQALEKLYRGNALRILNWD